MTFDRAELRKRAEAANQGERTAGWRYWCIRRGDNDYLHVAQSPTGEAIPEFVEDGDRAARDQWRAESDYWVASSPSTILALLDRIEELEGALRPFVDLVKSHDDAGVSFLRSDQADAAARLTYDELAELFAPAHEVPLTDGAMRSPIKITWGDFRRARKALSGE